MVADYGKDLYIVYATLLGEQGWEGTNLKNLYRLFGMSPMLTDFDPRLQHITYITVLII